jgi:hypothetical protein
MRRLGQIWEKYGNLILQQILTILIVVAGFFILNSGVVLIPSISEYSNILITVGITVIFIGVSFFHTNLISYKADQDTAGIKEQLIRIEQHLPGYIPKTDTNSPSEPKPDPLSQTLRIEQKKLELEILKVCLTFSGLAVAIEVFIIGSPNFPEWTKTLGLIVLLILIVSMGYTMRSQLNQIRKIFK